MELVLIAAVAANGVIGRNGVMPWHHPADLQRFKRLTTGHPVIMGRRTFERIVDRLGEPLPERTNVVLSRTLASEDVPSGVLVAETPEDAIDIARAHAEDRAFVAGGGSVYETFLSAADRMFLTELHEAYEGDTRFPAFDPADWREVAREERAAFDFVEYERVA